MQEEETCLIRIKNTGLYAHLSKVFPDGSMSFSFIENIQGAALFTIGNAAVFLDTAIIDGVNNEDLERVTKDKAMFEHGGIIRQAFMN